MLNFLVVILGSMGGFAFIYFVDRREQKQERLRKKSERRKRWRERNK